MRTFVTFGVIVLAFSGVAATPLVQPGTLSPQFLDSSTRGPFEACMMQAGNWKARSGPAIDKIEGAPNSIEFDYVGIVEMYRLNKDYESCREKLGLGAHNVVVPVQP